MLHHIVLITYNITMVKEQSNVRLTHCNKSLSWKLIGEVSEDPNAFRNLAKLLFYLSIVIEFFVKIQPKVIFER